VFIASILHLDGALVRPHGVKGGVHASPALRLGHGFVAPAQVVRASLRFAAAYVFAGLASLFFEL